MKVALINPRGFCFGVRRALEMMDSVKNQNVYVLHEIVHNKNVMEGYVKKGFRFTESISDIPAGSHVVISAHGIGQNIEDELKKNFVVSDTTCPFVKKIHKIATNAKNLIIAGNIEHPEVKGIIGNCENKFFVAKDIDELKKIVHNIYDAEDTYTFVSQTTFSVKAFEEMKKFLSQYENKENTEVTG